MQTVKDITVSGKRVFLRADLDAPLTASKIIADDTRLVVGLPTLQYLLDQHATVIVAGHLRRPEGIDPSLSLYPIVQWLSRHAKTDGGRVQQATIGQFPGWQLSEKLFVLENLRFYKEETVNDPAFAAQLAALADVYINDAFASSHRSHASIVGVPKLISHAAGPHMHKEITVLSKVMQEPKRPFVVLIGGVKLETKIPLVKKMHALADCVLVGGKLGLEKEALAVIQQEHGSASLVIGDLTADQKDITDASVAAFIQEIHKAKTIIWNGPVGLTGEGLDETLPSEKGTKAIAEAILASGAYSVVGGGDTIEYLKKERLLEQFNFFSTGGGAMLAFLSGETLPGIAALA